MRDRHVDATHVREMPDQSLVPVVDVPALARMEGANLGRRRAAVKAAGADPDVEGDDAGTGDGEQAKPRPLPPDPLACGVGRIAAQAMLQDRKPFAKRSDVHASGVVSMLKTGTPFALAGFWPRRHSTVITTRFFRRLNHQQSYSSGNHDVPFGGPCDLRRMPGGMLRKRQAGSGKRWNYVEGRLRGRERRHHARESTRQPHGQDSRPRVSHHRVAQEHALHENRRELQGGFRGCI